MDRVAPSAQPNDDRASYQTKLIEHRLMMVELRKEYQKTLAEKELLERHQRKLEKKLSSAIRKELKLEKKVRKSFPPGLMINLVPNDQIVPQSPAKNEVVVAKENTRVRLREVVVVASESEEENQVVLVEETEVVPAIVQLADSDVELEVSALPPAPPPPNMPFPQVTISALPLPCTQMNTIAIPQEPGLAISLTETLPVQPEVPTLFSPAASMVEQIRSETATQFQSPEGDLWQKVRKEIKHLQAKQRLRQSQRLQTEIWAVD